MDGLTGIVQTRLEHCSQHGAYESHSFKGKAWSGCPYCYEAEQAEARERRVQAERELSDEQARRNFALRVEQSGLPKRYAEKTLDTYSPECAGATNAKEQARAFLRALYSGDPAGLVLLGKPGTGKTHLAAAIVLNALRHGRTARYATAQAMVGRIKDAWRRDSKESEGEAIRAFVAPDVLVIDEVGAQFGSDAEKLLLFRVLNERYAECRPVVLASNIGQVEFSAFVGERIVDRLREDGGVVVPFSWGSFRGGVHE